ncbi:hypothetical protein SAMN04244559_02175 [Magnetospirillum fulvum]|uniref:Hemerythrin-like domain-containing protein n=2 Tax=Magnetospirillum fulvum TaxID=1082 RepID=A0A1H6I0Q4_MAGFU|nr:hypothetical protein SAMN04244559_02175 [Magnetospirillum fulvum]
MFRWNMSLETGIEAIDRGRRALIEAMADFFRALDDPFLDRRMVAERTGAIFIAMKAAFAAEDEFLNGRDGGEAHQAKHGTLILAYVDLCKKMVPKIGTAKQAQQTCLEIYRIIDGGLYHHLKDEVLPYKAMVRSRKSA